jgi:YVTN family beta-propeller protein
MESSKGVRRYHGVGASRATSCLLWLFCANIFIPSNARLAESDTSIIRLPEGSRPDRVAISPKDDSKVYVSNAGSGTVSVIDTATNSVSPQPIKVGKQPGPMAIPSDEGRLLFVGNRGGFEYHQGSVSRIEGSVSVIDITTKVVIATIPVGGEIIDLAVTPDGRKLYLAMGGPECETGLKKIVMTDGYTVAWVSKEHCPKAVVFTPDGQRAYVNYQCRPRGVPKGHDPIMVYDALTDSEVPLTIITHSKDRTRIANVGGPLAIAPNGRRLWAAGNDACARRDYAEEGKDVSEGCPPITPEETTASYTGRGIINIIDTDENKVIYPLSFLGHDVNDPAKPIGAYVPTFSPDGEKVAVTTGSGIQIYSAGNPLDGHPAFPPVIARATNLAFTRDGHRAYAAIPDKDLVEEIQIDPKEIRIRVTPTWSYVLTALGMLFGGTVLLSPTIARGGRVLLGQRLSFVSQASDYEVVIRANESAAELITRDRRVSDYPRPTESDPAHGTEESDEDAFRVQWELYGNIRASFRLGSTILVESSDAQLFRRPWAALLTGDLGATSPPAVAGQVRGFKASRQSPSPRVKRLVFAPIGCPTPHNRADVIPGLAAHLQRLAGLLAHRLVAIGDENPDADVASLVRALETADIVHVMAHASPAGIDLKDRMAARSDLEAAFRVRAPRCRLLVLAACSINRLEGAAFIERLLEAGTSVLGATEEMDPIVAETFFDAFYTDLVPRRGRAGASIADAMRASGRACAQRHGDKETARNNMRALIFYGDPTLHLVLDWR